MAYAFAGSNPAPCTNYKMALYKQILAKYTKLLTIILLVLASFCLYWMFVHKPSSAEFLELQRQEKVLNLPAGRRDTSDFGCQWVQYENKTECSRSITRVYTDTSSKKQIERSLSANGWTPKTDTMDITNTDLNKDLRIHTESYDFYAKESSQGKLCAAVKLEYNANYKKSGPWAVTLDLFGKTESCQKRIS